MRHLLTTATMSLFVATAAFAADAPAPTGAALDLSDDAVMTTVLNQSKGQNVVLRLYSGTELSGKLSEVGEIAVRVTELTGKDFYEAVVRTDNIEAVITRSKGK